MTASSDGEEHDQRIGGIVKIIRRVFVMTLVLIAAASVNCWAGDNIQVNVSNPSPLPSVKYNGNDVIQGTIQLYYTVEGYDFPHGLFGTFQIDMVDLHLSGAQNAAYPAPLTLKQNGSQNLILSAAPSAFDVTGLGWTDSSVVTITIPNDVPHADGTTLVGNLNFSIPGANKVGTPTSVQVHIVLEWPTHCLKVYNFLADAGAETVYDDTFFLDVKVKNGEVKSASPGTNSYNVLVSNLCSQDITVDLGAALDTSWEVNGPQGVKLYSAAGDIDLTDYSVNDFANPLNNGNNVCFQNATILTDQTVLLNIKMQLESGLLQTDIGDSPFTFSGSLREALSSCAGPLEPMADPNPVSADLPFTVTIQASSSKK